MNDYTNIFANRMRSATSAAQRKILMQQAEAVISMASDPVEAARERASKAVSLYDDADAAMEKAAKEYQQAKVAAENARADENRKLSQASYTRDGSRPITGAEVTKQANEANKRLKSFDDRVEKAEKAYQQARKNYDAAAADKQKAQAEYVAANVQARSGKMQAEAVNFAVTDQKGQPLKVGDKVKTSRGVTGVITEIIGSRVYVQSEDSFDTHKTGEATWVEPADRLVKMQADVSMAVSREDREQAADVARRADQQKAVIKYANMISRIASDIVTATQNDENQRSRSLLSNLKSWVTVMQTLINDLD